MLADKDGSWEPERKPVKNLGKQSLTVEQRLHLEQLRRQFYDSMRNSLHEVGRPDRPLQYRSPDQIVCLEAKALFASYDNATEMFENVVILYMNYQNYTKKFIKEL